MLKVSPGCYDNLLSIWNVSYGSHLLVLSRTILLWRLLFLAALPGVQSVEYLGHSVQIVLVRHSLHFPVVVSIRHIQSWSFAWEYAVIGLSQLPYYLLLGKGLACGFWMPPANHISPKGKTGLHSYTMRYDRECVPCHIGEISAL